MSGKFLARASALSLAFLLAACGGGGDGSTPLAGTGNNSGNGGGGSESPQESETRAASIQLLTDTPVVESSGDDTATVTAVVRDKEGVLLSEVPVSFSASDNGTINVVNGTTNDSGQASAEVYTLASDPRNRSITITATASNVSESVSIDVSGTTIGLTGPTAVSNGGEASYEARLQDSNGSGIAGVLVSVETDNNSISEASSFTTDSQGRVQFTLAANNSGPDVITVSAYEGDSRVGAQLNINVSADSFAFNNLTTQEVEIGDSQELTVVWTRSGSPVVGQNVNFTTTRGSVDTPSVATNASGEATVNVSSTDVGLAQITALAEGSDGEDIQTTRNVEFVSSDPNSLSIRASQTQIGTNEETNIIVTVRDSNGNLVKGAPVSFNLTDPTGGTLSPGTVNTDAQGRAITTYRSTSSISERDGVIIRATITRNDSTQAEEELLLTVGGEALTLVLGTGNTISAPNETLYDMPWSVLVTDANGNASSNQSVQLSVLPLEFSKGNYIYNGDVWEPNITETCETTQSDELTGTDIANPASAPTSVITDEFGSAEFNVRYPKGECTWVRVRLQATSNVEGFSSTNERTFTLPCLADDISDEGINPPGGIESPYNGEVCN